MIFQHTTGFTRGEVDESVSDRADVDFYNSAALLLQNFSPDLAGGISRRQGMKILPMTSNDPEPFEDTEADDLYLQTFYFSGYQVLVRFRSAGTNIYINAGLRREGVVDEGTIDTVSETISVSSWEEDNILSLAINTVSIGPAMFITSSFFAPRRIFISGLPDSPEVNIEEIIWYEELLGTVEVDNGSNTWKGTDTLFKDQLSAGDKFYFKDAEYEVDSITNQEELKTTENYSGVSLAGERIRMVNDDPFEGNPHLCTFFKSRLFLFSTQESPNKMWASKIGDPFTIIPGSVYDDSPISYELLSEGADSFVWVATGDNIYLGASQAEYMIMADTDGPITPTNFGFTRISSLGGAAVQPVTSNASIIFVSRDRTRIFGVTYDFQRRGFTSQDITLLSSHLFKNKIRALSFRPATTSDQAPRLFVLTDEYEVRTAAISEDQNVVSWARLNMANVFTIRALVATSQNMFFQIQDTTQANVTHAISYLSDTSDDAFVMDFPVKYELDEAKTTPLELFHQDKQIVVISENKGFLGFYDVEASLDLSETEGNIGEVTVGVAFVSKLEMLPTVVGSDQGMSLNRKIRLLRTILSVRNAYQLFVNDLPLFGVLGAQLGKEIPRKDGVFEKRMLGWVYKDKVTIESASIYPVTILSITREVSV